MENLEIFDKVRSVPDHAKREIMAGRLKGKTDINPLWRIKALTELFGPCGFGWRYEITKKHMEAGAGNEIAAFVDIDLFVKLNEEWSAAIQGTGGSMFVSSERNGPYTSDECYKMALTDAISVACKALGVGADVYWAADKTKYTETKEPTPVLCSACKALIVPTLKKDGTTATVAQVVDYSKRKFGAALCPECQRKAFAQQSEAAE